MVQLAHIFKKDKDKEKSSKDDDSPTSPRTSFAARKSPASSPSKSPSKSPTKSSSKSPTKSTSKNRFSHSRTSSSSTPTAPAFKFGKSSKDQDLHPLNLPPDELRRRLSAMADQRSSMDIDPQDVEQQKNDVNENTEERSPTPPPHRSESSSTDEADSFKLAGNKFFKDGNFARAIEEYNKGMLCFACL